MIGRLFSRVRPQGRATGVDVLRSICSGPGTEPVRHRIGGESRIIPEEVLRMKKITAVLALILLSAVTASAQSADEFIQKASRAYDQKQFAQAAALYEKAFAAGSDDDGAAYEAACCYALIGGRDKAFEFLKKAGELGWSDADHARKGTDLESLRTDPRWEPALALFDKNAKYEQAMWDSPAWNAPYAEELSEELRIAGLSRFWSEVKYNFAFPEKLAALDWDALYISFIPRVRAARSTVEYYRVLQELCAKLQDGHTYIIRPHRILEDSGRVDGPPDPPHRGPGPGGTRSGTPSSGSRVSPRAWRSSRSTGFRRVRTRKNT